MKITICGDLSPQGVNEVFEKGDIKTLFNDVPEVFKDSDKVIVNLEVALTNSDYKIEKFGPNIKATPNCAKVLKEAGFTDCLLANNHIFDFGLEGLNDTIKVLEEEGFGYTGIGENYEDARKNMIIEKDGKKVAVINVCEHEYSYALKDRIGTRGIDWFDTMVDISNAKKENDFVVVVFHGGKEMCYYPSPRLRKMCQSMAWHGADVVLCQHSHCIGCYENYNGAHILYGQGNFHFVEFGKDAGIKDFNIGLITQLDINDKIDISFIPVETYGKGIRLAKGEVYDEIMNDFKNKSQTIIDGTYLDKWHEFCETKRQIFVDCIHDACIDNPKFRPDAQSAINYFSHLLRCEAHHDVIEELFPLSWETRKRP